MLARGKCGKVDDGVSSSSADVPDGERGGGVVQCYRKEESNPPPPPPPLAI